MDPNTAGIMCIAVLLVLMAMGMHIGFAMFFANSNKNIIPSFTSGSRSSLNSAPQDTLRSTATSINRVEGCSPI